MKFEVHIRSEFSDKSAKVSKVGGLNKAAKTVKMQQKNEAVQNRICAKLDRSISQKSKRAQKRALRG